MEVDQSSSTASKNQVDSVDTDKTQDTVAYETHKRLLGQRKADLEKRREIEQELETFKAAAKENEQLALEEQGKHKELADHFKAELKKTQAALTERDEMINDGIKLQAFKSKVGGEFKNPKYMSFVDLDRIGLREDGTVDEGTLEMTVNSFLKEHGNDLLNRGTGRKLPSDAASVAVPINKQLSEMDLDELSAKMKQNLTKIM